MAFINFKDFHFTYPLAERPALKHIDLAIEQGEFVVFCGVSGCGKTTLLKQLKQDIAPHGDKSGAILLKNQTIESLTPRERAEKIGYVLQNPENQIITDKVWHELAFGLENLGVESQVIRRRVAEMANFFGIQSLFHADTMHLSGGQKQLLNLASIMVMQPDVLILDEPTSQLDPIAATEFIQILQKLNKELGLTILLVEHRLEEVYPIADRVVMLEQGEIIANGSPKTVAKSLQATNSQHPMLQGLPTPLRIHHALQLADEPPLTIREGRTWLTKHFQSGSVPYENAVATQTPILEVKKGWFRYEAKGTDILKEFDLTLHRAEIFTLLGGNGSGKSTAMQVMAGLMPLYRGQVLLNGRPLKKYRPKELYGQLIGVLPQNPQTIFVAKTVHQEFEDITSRWTIPEAEKDAKLLSMVRQLGIEHILTQHPLDLSGGEQQKVALAKVLLNEPEILLLDEPTKGMDGASKQNFAQILTHLKAQGLTIFIVTHDVEFSAEFADRAALFFDGNIVSVDERVAFYSGNHFYTTATHRMSRHVVEQAITPSQLIRYYKESVHIES